MSKGSLVAAEHGIMTRHEIMPNGELRFRLVGTDGNGYVRTVSGESGGWQNSHFHLLVRETYIVESGWMALAEWDDDGEDVVLTRFTPGDIVTTAVGREHNVYLPNDAIIHTVKHGCKTPEPDWHPAPKLDAATKGLTRAEILARVQHAELDDSSG